MRLRGHWPLAASLLLSSLRALADTTTDCIDANEQSIQLRRDHKLIEARVEVAKCAAMSCSEDIRELCTDRANKLNEAIPSIVFEVKDGQGQDLTLVKVTVDGSAPTSDPTVTALDLDPGPHTFLFEHAGQAVERSFVLREGERQRRESIVLAPLPIVAPPASLPTAAVPPQPTLTRTGRPLRTAGIATGAVGLGGLIFGGVFGGVAAAKWSSSESECRAAGCSMHSEAVTDHDTAVTFASLSTVGFVVGGVLLASGVTLFLWPAVHKDSAAWTLTPTIALGQGGAAASGQF